MESRNIQTSFLGILTLIALGTVLHFLQRVFIPLAFAALVSLMSTPLVNRLTKLKVPRFIGIILVMSVVFIVLYGVGKIFYSSLYDFVSIFETYQSRFSQILREIWARFKIPEELFPTMGWTRNLLDLIIQTTDSFVNFGTSLGLALIFILLMQIETPLSWRKLKRAFPHHVNVKVARTVSDSSNQVARYLILKTMLSAVTGLLVWLSLSIIGQDLAQFWGLMAFLLNYIPSLGSLFVLVITMTLGFVQFYPDWNRIIAVWITMPAIQIVIGSLIDPQLQGHQLDLSPLVILISLIIWGWIWGFAGMFLAVPLAVTLKISLSHIESLRPIAIMMGSGRMSRSFRRNWRKREKKN
ncbi:hypothetical protein S1OALGB6SA_1225 [Olavius algarvensis spirochete endosymbiont]|uniref:AI-2E family transporter n=1 Tax=Olavius algarvensis spirochete endosymbiont TaxID=260710 RepID=UPI00052BE1E2|nr:AI-2E family transporter [Olavius algarvensis spirochete endosymbiont]KGM38395.1 hypothetical protein JY97_16565 [Alkalispirochaeta odontotermitis]CAD7845562.1 MAG: hypothetical protein [Olavius algarvensis spirochete endosymbiont]VDB00150.1 hypothetical protein S1OALGB6SA_1225 [Olavius algarvensis spirochete endosymbiont]